MSYNNYKVVQDNSEINKCIESFTQNLLINGLTGELWDAETLNEFDRTELAKEFIDGYFSETKLKSEGYDAIGGKKIMMSLKLM